MGAPAIREAMRSRADKGMCMQIKLSTQAKNAAGFHLAGYLHNVADGGGGAIPAGCILILLS
jgi:hypothetical protein